MVKSCGVGTNPFPISNQIGFDQKHLHQVAGANRPDEGHHQGFEVAEPLVLKVEDGQHIERRQADADQKRNMEKQVERDGRPDHLRQIAGGDGNFTQHPQEQAGAARIIAAAGLRQVELGDDAQPRGKRLNQDRHQIGHEEDEDELVGKARPARDIRGPVSRVHVPDCDQKARPGKRQHFLPEGRTRGDAYGPMNLRQRGRRD